MHSYKQVTKLLGPEQTAMGNSGPWTEFRVSFREIEGKGSLAWWRTVGSVAQVFASFGRAGDRETMLSLLVDMFVDAGYRYLVPQEPDELDTWGPHLKEVYIELCGLSSRRDRQGQHSSAEKRVTVGPEKTLTVAFKLGNLDPDTEKYLDTLKLKVSKFAWPDYAAYRGAEAIGPPMNAKVKLRNPGTAYFTSDVYSQPGADIPGVLQVDDSEWVRHVLSKWQG